MLQWQAKGFYLTSLGWSLYLDDIDTHLHRKKSVLFLYHPSRYIPGYLNGTLHDECCELRHHKVHTFEAGFFKFEDLLFYYCLESQVRGEEPCSGRSRGQIAFGFSDRERDRQTLRKDKGKTDRKEKGEIKTDKSSVSHFYFFTDKSSSGRQATSFSHPHCCIASSS